jgi:hypothetical protein
LAWICRHRDVKRNQRREYKYWQVEEKEECVSSVGSPQILCLELHDFSYSKAENGRSAGKTGGVLFFAATKRGEPDACISRERVTYLILGVVYEAPRRSRNSRRTYAFHPRRHIYLALPVPWVRGRLLNGAIQRCPLSRHANCFGGSRE